MRDLQASLDAVGRQNAAGCVKIEEDLIRYQVIIDRVKPDLIVESGTFSGKSALWLCRAAGRCPVITMDVTPCLDPETELAWKELPIQLVTGDAVGDLTVAFVGQTIAAMSEQLGRPARVMVSLDSDHSATHVMAEIEAYGSLVSPESYIVVEDTLLRWMPWEERRHYTGTPLDAVEALLAAEPDGWEVDIELEDRFPATQHPYGWLRRLR